MDICIVTFNRKRYLERCIWSIIAGTSGSYRIHVIDDMSTDETHGFLDEMLERELIHTVIKNKKKGGTANNFNKIIESSDGEWFAMANDDMWFHRGWDVEVKRVASEYDDCGAVSFFDYQRIGVDKGVEKLADNAWRVLRTGLGATYMNRDSFNKAGRFQLPQGKAMGFFATSFCNKMRESKLKRNRVYHLPVPMAIHIDAPWCKLNERDYYSEYGEFRSKQKNGTQGAANIYRRDKK